LSGQEWYEQYAETFGGYRKLWDSRIAGDNGEAAFTAWLRTTIPAYPRVLDVGCGDGIYTLHMSALAKQIAGIDFAPAMIALARKYQQSAAIENAQFVAASVSTDALPFADGALDLIYSRRGPSSHLRDAKRVLRPGGLVAGLHTGAQEVIIKRIEQAGFNLLENREFKAVEILPTLQDLALFLSRTPGNPDYTLAEHAVALEALAQQSKAEQGYQVDRWWFMWVAVKP
jgi:SAM-dependent methyltransferase